MQEVYSTYHGVKFITMGGNLVLRCVFYSCKNKRFESGVGHIMGGRVSYSRVGGGEVCPDPISFYSCRNIL